MEFFLIGKKIEFKFLQRYTKTLSTYLFYSYTQVFIYYNLYLIIRLYIILACKWNIVISGVKDEALQCGF